MKSKKPNDYDNNMGDNSICSHHEVRVGETLNVYPLTLRAPDGRELRTLAWFPNDAVRQDFYAKAIKRGLKVIENIGEK